MKKLLLLSLFVFAITVQAAAAKNIIWLIGDGMGPGAAGMLIQSVKLADVPGYEQKQSVLEKFLSQSVNGYYFNDTYDTIVTDSACAATQMASGVRSRPGSLGVDAHGKTVQTIMEDALQVGKSVGVVTDVYVQDATPAGFLAHVQNRKERAEISRQLVRSGAQVVMGGGMKYFALPENKDLLKQAKKQGWQLVQNRKELGKLKKGRALGVFAHEAMPFYGDKDHYPQTPTLLEMTKKAIELLSQNENGFVLMVEAGKIDWALHNNEGGPALYELFNLDETLAYIWEYARQSGDTLVYVNADHETGVPVFHYRHLDAERVAHKSAVGEMLYDTDTDYVAQSYYQKLLLHKHLLYYVFAEFKKLPAAAQTAERLQQMCDEATGMHWDLKLNGVVPNSVAELVGKLNDAQGLTWATGQHSSGMLIGAAYGPGAEEFGGIYHNTDIKRKMEKVLGL